MTMTIVDPQKQAIELCGTLDGARSDLTSARQELKVLTAEQAPADLSPKLREQYDEIAAWLLDVEASVRNAEDEANQLVDLVATDTSHDEHRSLVQLVLDAERGLADWSDVIREAHDAEIGE